MENNISNFQLEYRISNNSNKELIVKTQGGLNYIVRKSKALVHPDNQHRRVFIKITNAKFDDLWLDPKCARTAFDRKVMEELKEEANRIGTASDFSYRSFSHTMSVTIRLTSDLSDENGIIHSDILGASMFSSEEQANVAPITSPEFTLEQLFDVSTEARDDQPKGGLHYFIYINDPLSVQQPIYTNVMGKATQVPSVQEKDKPAGLYVGLSYGNVPPKKLYYSFDRLEKADLDMLGLFKTREECELGGNTARALSAEAKLKDNIKAVEKLQSSYSNVVELLDKAEQSVAKLGMDLVQTKADHRIEITQLKNDHRMELMSHQFNQNALKAKSDIKDSIVKANQELDKKRNSTISWVEVVKAVGVVSTTLLTGYKLLTS